MRTIQLHQWKDIFCEITKTIAINEKTLNELDSLIGDGDHGSSVRRGFEAIQPIVEDTSISTIGELFSKIGVAMMSNVGGAIGPILGSFFSAVAKPANTITETDLSVWAKMFALGVEKVSAFGKAKRGDKTLLDALLPASEVFQEAAQLDLPFGFATRRAADAAQLGAEGTRAMVAAFGRAKFLGERSLGHKDPGSYSIFLILDTIASTIAAMSNPSTIIVKEIDEELHIESDNLMVKITQEKKLFEFAAKNTDYTLRQADPFTFFQEAEKTILTTEYSSWHQESDQVIITFDTNEVNTHIFVTVSFPLPYSCQVQVQTNLPLLLDSQVSFSTSHDEQFFGGGERFSTVNQRGNVVDCWTDDRGLEQKQGHSWSYWPVPFFLSNRGYGLFVHNNEKSTFDLCASDPTVFKVMISSPNIRYELFWGDHPAENINMLLDRTGRPTAPPIWNNGVWITCLGGEDTVLEKARFLRKEHVPCSALWVYDAHDPRGNIGWPICPMHHSGIYHDVPGMVKQLHEMGFKVQTYLFPYFYVDSILYPEADQNGYFLKKADGTTYQMPFFRAVGRETIKIAASILDFTNPDAKAWWQNLIHYVVADLGFDGWMHDFGEKIPEEVVAYNGLTGVELHNLYPVLYQQAAREVCNEYKPDASFYARSGFTGSQAWVTASWPGDQICTWEANEGLASALTACLSLSLCGVFYIGPDIGGYFGRGIQQESNNYSKELWIRWTQLGALSSIMRDHLGDKPDGSIELWTDKETLQVFKKYAWLHMALSPYIQGCAYHSLNSGDPIMRHMFLVEPSNPAFWNCDNQYLFGDALLVAPVLEDGMRSRSVILPEGNWIDYWNGEYYVGGKEVILPAPIDQIPLLVKEATVLPILLNHADTLVQSTDNSVTVATDDLKLMVFIPADWKNRTGGNCVSYRVLADGTELENVWSNNSLHININGPKKRTYLIEIPSSSIPKTCKLNSRSVIIDESSEILEGHCIYDPSLQKLFIRYTDLDLKIELSS